MLTSCSELEVQDAEAESKTLQQALEKADAAIREVEDVL